MTLHVHYRLNRHRKFERDGQKYVADLETNAIVEVNDVEWEVLSRYGTRTHYQIVEELKETYKIESIFDGIERLERLGQRGSLLSAIDGTARQTVNNWKQRDRKPKVLVPFHFTKEKTSLDYGANLNRYQLLTHLTQFADLETLTFSKAGEADAKSQDFQGYGDIEIRDIETEEISAFGPSWYAMNGYDGILLLSQFLTDDLLYYQLPDVPIIHCIDDVQRLQGSTLDTLLNICAFQNVKNTLVVRSSWVKEWLMEYGVLGERVCVIPNGMEIGEPIGKPLAKQHTAVLFEKPMFAQQPVVGLISGFDPNSGAKLISTFAYANPHLVIFVYDPFLAAHWTNPPDNVVIFSADDEETRSVLPIFFQALDLVCFPAVPGTPLSLVLEAMAYGTPCVAMTKYGLPPEVEGAGVAVKSEQCRFGNFHIPMCQLSDTVNQWLKPSPTRSECEEIAKSLVQKFTWEKVAQEIVQLFEAGHQQSINAFNREKTLLPSVFCRRYDPGTGNTKSSVYRLGTNRYEHLETALVEILSEQHTPTEVEYVFKHFRGEGSSPAAKRIALEMVFPTHLSLELNPAGPEPRQKGEKPR